MKESFIIRKKYKEQIDLLNTEQKAQLLEAIFHYQTEWSPPEWIDPLVSMLLSIMIQERTKDDQKYFETLQKRIEGGKKWWRPNKNWENLQKPWGLKNNLKGWKETSSPPVYDNDNVNDNENINKEKEGKEKYKDFVFLSPSEFQTLKELLWKWNLENYIENLNNYLGQKWKKYKSHYHTIRNWRNKDQKTKQTSKSENYSSDNRNLSP